MAEVSDFTPAEIEEFKKALVQVVIGAAISEKGGPFSMAREIVGGLKASAQFMTGSTSPLLQEIVQQSDSNEADEAAQKDDSTADAQVVMDAGVEAATKTHKLLVDKGFKDDADAYAQLLLTAANAAINAAKSGSFLGFGGERVTPSEEAYVQRIADALGYQKNAKTPGSQQSAASSQ